LREPKTTVFKSIMSSIVEAVFDTLGLIIPTVVLIKIFLNELCFRKLFWTGHLPSELLKQSMIVYSHLLHMNNCKFVGISENVK